MPAVGFPTFEQLQVLAAIAEAGSFSAAARRLNRAQSVISYAIAQLEEQLGLSLFDRTGRLPRLTDAGRALLADARRVTAAIDTLRARAAGLQQGLEAELRLAVDVMYPAERVVAALDAFAAVFPTVTLRLYVEALGAVTQLVRAGICDLGVSPQLAVTPVALVRRAAGSVRLVSVTAPSHPLAKLPPPLTRDAVRETIQIVLSDRSALTDGEDFGVLSLRTWRIADLGAKHMLLRAGLGWGNMPEPMVRDDIAAEKLVRLELEELRPVDYPFVLIHRADALPGPAARWLSDRLIAHERADESE